MHRMHWVPPLAFFALCASHQRISAMATYEVAVWIDDPWRVPMRHSELNEILWKALDE